MFAYTHMVIYWMQCRVIKMREEQVESLVEKTLFSGCVVWILRLPFVRFSHFSCSGRAVACIHPLTFHANLCLSILVCVYNGGHKHIHTRVRRGT